MNRTFDLDVVLPCLDEAAALPEVLAGLPAGVRAIVVDNGSRDGSAEVARQLGATVVLETRRGYGAACHRGLLEATAAVVAFCDADASLRLSDLPLVAGPVLAGDADLVLGRRMAGRGSWPWHARLANSVLAVPVSLVARHRLHDLGPLRAAPRERLLELAVTDRRSGYPLETVLRAARAGWRVREVPVPYAPRVGRSKVTGTVRGTAQAVSDMTRVLVADGRGR
jgi:glycosyltransferase involved in cell wall biosynthesis